MLKIISSATVVTFQFKYNKELKFNVFKWNKKWVKNAVCVEEFKLSLTYYYVTHSVSCKFNANTFIWKS